MKTGTMGETLREVRKSRGLSMKIVAKKAGISAPYLSDIERGYRMPSHKSKTIIKLLKVLRINEARK